MRVFACAFWTAKAGHEPGEYEDACWPAPIGEEVREVSEGPARFAVADGATESSFSGMWARTVVKAFCRGALCSESDEALRGSLPRWQRYWRRRVGQRPLPWYAEEKLEEGAYAAMVGLTLWGAEVLPRTWRWRAEAVGDCCVVQVHGGEVVGAFPMQHASDFDNRPVLIPSGEGRRVPEGHLFFREGHCEVDDTFYLMSDALACWFLGAHERGEGPDSLLRELGTRDEVAPFGEWVQELRNRKLMRNDDVTLLRVTIT